MTETGTIRKLTVHRFRGLRKFEWKPASGMNVILGGGDVGKTTVLEAIALLLSPSNSLVISESDYWRRDSSQEFFIEAVLALPESSAISTQSKFSWPWAWDGKDAVLPVSPEGSVDDIPQPDDPVYRVRVRGTGELELAWEILQPHGQADHFSVALRRSIGAVRLSSNERNDRDLRLVYGSALDRLLADKALRARIGKDASQIALQDSLNAKSKEAIRKLDQRLSEAALPGALRLGLTTSQGLSIGALIGLLAEGDGAILPLATWGAGTRRMVALEIATLADKGASVTIVDEIERGLEPYRLRRLIDLLLSQQGQTFVTTHSPVAVGHAENAHLWYLDSLGTIGALPREKIRSQQRRDPETFLAKVALVAEGPTEVGFLGFLLEKAFDSNPLDHGVRVCDGQGNDATLELLETLSSSGLVFAGFADNEGRNPERWQRVKEKLGRRLFQWETGCTEQNVVRAVPQDRLVDLLKDAEGDFDGERLRTLADRLGIGDKGWPAIEQALIEQQRTLCDLIVGAATGDKTGAPEGSEKVWQSHGGRWFKSKAGGREMAEKMVVLEAWDRLETELMPLINAILESVGRPSLERLHL